MDELMEVPFHRALHRSNLILGGERKPMMFCLLLVVVMIVPALNMVSFVIGSVFAVIFIFGLRLMAKADPMMLEVFTRQIQYRDYYPAHSRYTRVSKSSKVY